MMSNLKINKGNDRVLELTIKDSAGTATDLTGASVEFLIWDSSTSVLEVGATLVTPAEGEIEVELTSEAMTLPTGDYRYEVVVVDIDGNRYTALQGILEITYSLGEGL